MLPSVERSYKARRSWPILVHRQNTQTTLVMSCAGDLELQMFLFGLDWRLSVCGGNGECRTPLHQSWVLRGRGNERTTVPLHSVCRRRRRRTRRGRDFNVEDCARARASAPRFWPSSGRSSFPHQRSDFLWAAHSSDCKISPTWCYKASDLRWRYMHVLHLTVFFLNGAKIKCAVIRRKVPLKMPNVKMWRRCG